MSSELEQYGELSSRVDAAKTDMARAEQALESAKADVDGLTKDLERMGFDPDKDLPKQLQEREDAVAEEMDAIGVATERLKGKLPL